MIRYRRMHRTLDLETVLREWVRREARKTEYPDADPTEWEEQRLTSELETTYEEPVQYATVRTPAWTELVVSGSEIEKFDPYPSIGCNWLTGGTTLAGAIERMESEGLSEAAPKFVEKVSKLRQQYPDHEFGAVVVRQFDETWPPVTLDGNHRAWAAIVAARDGLDVEVSVHLGHETPLDELPLETSDTGSEAP